MLSRIADSLFWLSRYMERNDCLIRVVRTHYILDFDMHSYSSFTWLDIMQLFSYPLSEEQIAKSEKTETALTYLLTDKTNFNSSKVLITRARENARGAQDNITKEVWEMVNQSYHLMHQPNLLELVTSPRALECMDEMEQSNILFYGVTDSTMPRGQGWDFMNLGKFVERAILAIDILKAHFNKINYDIDQPQDLLYWKHLLYSLSGYELYLKTYTRGSHNENIIDHVLFHHNFPRSIVYSLDRVQRYLDEIAADTEMGGSDALKKSLGRIYSRVEYADLNFIKQEGLESFLNKLRYDLIEFSNQLTRIYFSYA